MLLKFAIQDFIEDREYNNSAESNIKNIRYNLRGFYDYCIENDLINVEDIKHVHVKVYMNKRRKLGDKPNTLNTRLLRIRSLFNYCVESEYISKSPATKVKRTLDDTRVNVFSDEQVEQMLGYYRRLKQRDKRMYAIRDYTLILFFISTGFRRSEVCNLKWADVDLERRTIKVFGKNRTLESVVITEKLTKELANFKAFLNRYFEDEEVEYVFPNRYGKQLTTNAVHLIFKELRKKMNFKDVRLSAHTFRHTFCHRLVTAGMSPFAVQRMMRHKNITVTMRYANMWGEELRQQNEEFNPLNNLNI